MLLHTAWWFSAQTPGSCFEVVHAGDFTVLKFESRMEVHSSPFILPLTVAFPTAHLSDCFTLPSILCLPNGNHMLVFFLECPTKHARRTHNVHLESGASPLFLLSCSFFFFHAVFFRSSFSELTPQAKESKHRTTSDTRQRGCALALNSCRAAQSIAPHSEAWLARMKHAA